MALYRYVFYFLGITLFTWLLIMLEITSPGSLKLQVFAGPGDTLGTSEYSPIEIIQPGILAICGLLYTWVAKYCISQRPIAFLFGGMALAFIIRESDYFLDRFVADNFWRLLLGIVAALVIVYTYRHRRRFRIAWLRMWPSPGLAAHVAVARPDPVVCRRYHHFCVCSAGWARALVDGDTWRRISTHRQTRR